MNKDELQDAYDELLEAMQEILSIVQDDRFKLSGKIARIEEIAEAFEESEDE